MRVQIFENWINGKLDQMVGEFGTVAEAVSKLSEKYIGVFRLHTTIITDRQDAYEQLNQLTDEYWAF